MKIIHSPGERENPGKYLLNFISKHPVSSERLKDAQPLEYHTGIFPIGPMFDSFTKDNFLDEGDGVC